MDKTAPVKCPCGFGFRIRREAVGNRVICPNCDTPHDIPSDWIRRFDTSPSPAAPNANSSVVPQPMTPSARPALAQAELASPATNASAAPREFNAYQPAVPVNVEPGVRAEVISREGRSKFWALETCALMLKCAAALIVVLWLVGCIVGILIGLATGSNDVFASLIPLSVTTVGVLLLGVLVWAVAEVIAVILAIEENTRNDRR